MSSQEYIFELHNLHFYLGPMSSRLPSAEARILLIEYLLSELMCFRKQEINKVVQTTQLNLVCIIAFNEK